MPNTDSITSMAASSSQARASICEPMIFAFRKYSSLCTVTRNISAMMAVCRECERPTTTSTVFEIRLPITGCWLALFVFVFLFLVCGCCLFVCGCVLFFLFVVFLLLFVVLCFC